MVRKYGKIPAAFMSSGVVYARHFSKIERLLDASGVPTDARDAAGAKADAVRATGEWVI
jgi:hypothetical protein